MGDMGEMFRDWREHKKQARQKRFDAADPTGWTRHTEHHWSRDLQGHQLDYWPSTGRFRWKGKSMFGDVKGFIAKRSPDLSREAAKGARP